MRSPLLRRLLRTLGRRPGLALAVVATLALGIGANTAIFSVVDAYLLRPLAYPHAERLVEVWDRQPPAERAPASLPELLDWQRSRSLDLLAGSVSMGLTLTGGDLPQRVRATLVTPGYLDLFGAQPLLGRGFTPGEEREGGPRAALLGYQLWRERFGGRRDVLGRALVLDGKTYEVVGVLGAGAPALGRSPATLWLPLLPNTPWRQEGVHYLTVVGRLRPGVSLAAARAETAAMVRGVDAARHRGHGIELVPLREHFVGDAAPRLALLLAAVGLVLLIAVANVAALLLARAVERAEELALRAALGAGRRALLVQGLEESVAYGLLGGIAGLAAGAWGTRALVAMLPADVPRLPEVGVDWRVLAFTAAVSLLVTLLCGLAPAWVGARADARASLAGGRTAGVSRASGRLRQALVVAQLSLCALLLVGAGLMLHSFQRLRAVDPGFRTQRLLTFQLSLPDSRYGEPALREALLDQLLVRVPQLPGVTAVALANDLPLTGDGMSGDLTVEGRTDAEPVTAWKWIVSERYFTALGIPLHRGRAFTPQDRTGSRPVTIVSEGLARRLWPGQDPLGKRLRVLVCGAD
ncbi:MAG TPA: ABC transporter permease, partial [Thermoanaerobaculia bacterium]|nr:ABC transporter permease [Thermoanaerobaculia bacterium]